MSTNFLETFWHSNTGAFQNNIPALIFGCFVLKNILPVCVTNQRKAWGHESKLLFSHWDAKKPKENIERLQSCPDLPRLVTNGAGIVLNVQGSMTTEDFHACSACFGVSSSKQISSAITGPPRRHDSNQQVCPCPDLHHPNGFRIPLDWGGCVCVCALPCTTAC